MPKVSIIIPVYNTEAYISRCLQSVQNQTVDDWECLLVDDGSTDKSGVLCDKYAEKDNRFIVIHKENGGVSTARNKGIEAAKGEYCCFIDSDDWLEPTYLQNFMDTMPGKYGVVLQSFYINYENSRRCVPILLPNKTIEKASELVCFLESADVVHNGFVWHRLFKLDIIKDNQIYYPVGISFAEDAIFFLNYILHTNNYLIINSCGYHYTKRDGSLTVVGHTLPADKYYHTIELMSQVIKNIIIKDNPDVSVLNDLKNYLWRLLYTWIVCRSMNSKYDYFRNQKFFFNFLKRYPVNQEVRTNSITMQYIISVVSKPPSVYRYFLLCFLRKIHRIEMKIIKLPKVIRCY